MTLTREPPAPIEPAYFTLVSPDGRETRMNTPQEASVGIGVDFPHIVAWRAYDADLNLIGEWPVYARAGEAFQPPTLLHWTLN